MDLELALLVIAFIAAKPQQAFVCGQFAAALAVIRQRKTHPAELLLIFCQMPVQQLFIAAVCRIGRIQLCCILVLLAMIEACSHAEQQCHLIGIPDIDHAADRAERAALCKAGECRCKKDAVPTSCTAVIDQHVRIVLTRAAVIVVIISAIQKSTQVHHARFTGSNMQHQNPIRL